MDRDADPLGLFEAGKPFEQLVQAGMKTAHLDQIVRQKDPELLRAVEDLSRGEVAEGIFLLEQQGIAGKEWKSQGSSLARKSRTCWVLAGEFSCKSAASNEFEAQHDAAAHHSAFT